MSIGDAIYQSVKLVCATILLIVALHFLLAVTQEYLILVALQKRQQPARPALAPEE